MAGIYAYNKQTEKHLLERQKKIPDICVSDDAIPNNCNFTFVDFVATSKWSREGVRRVPFKKLVDFANEWLINHYMWEVMGCETHTTILEVNYDPRKCTSTITVLPYSEKFLGVGIPSIIFRIWIKKKSEECTTESNQSIQQIKYIDFIPENKNKNFETLDSIVKRINEKIKNQEIEGKIINIQTLSIASSDWTIDSESTTPIIGGRLVYIIRLFYELGPACERKVSIADFVPQCVSSGSIFKAPKFENQSQVMRRASKWLSDNPQITLCSAQTLDFKLKTMSTSIDTQKMAYNIRYGDFVRILRISCTKSLENDDEVPQSTTLPAPVYLLSETFIRPVKEYLPAFSKDFKIRIDQFFSRDEWSAEEKFKWKFLNCETVSLLVSIRKPLIDESFIPNRLHYKFQNYYSTDVIKVYFDAGIYGVKTSLVYKTVLLN